MLKCITFDGDAATLDSLMSYFEKIDKALEEVNEILQKEEEPLFVKEGNKIIRICREEILYLEGYGDYVKIHKTSGKTILSQVSLKRFEGCLTGKTFCRVHRSYIVAIPQINYIERKRIRIGNDLIPVSNSYYPLLMEQLTQQRAVLL